MSSPNVNFFEIRVDFIQHIEYNLIVENLKGGNFNMSIGQNIKRIRENAGMTQQQLAVVAGVTDKAVSMWELGTRAPRMGALQKISDYFHVAKSELIDEVPKAAQGGFVQIPVFESVGKAGDLFDTGAPIAYEWVPGSALSSKDRCFFMVMHGQEMAPLISEGDLVLICVGAPVTPGDYAAVCYIETGRVCINKVVHSQHENRIVLICENPYYPKQVFTGEETKKISVIGAVRRVVRNF